MHFAATAIIERKLRRLRGWRRNPLAQKLLNHKFPAQHRAGAKRIGSRGEDRGHAQHAASVVIGQLNATGLTAFHVGDVVKRCQLSLTNV